jgi:hypothetical protein
VKRRSRLKRRLLWAGVLLGLVLLLATVTIVRVMLRSRDAIREKGRDMQPRVTRRARGVAIAALALVALALPVTAGAGAEQFVISLVDEPISYEFPDPCRGGVLAAEGTESGVVRITELGEQGHHVRVDVRGTADLYDGDTFVGTWTYHLRFGDQFPPGGQGAVHQVSVGPLEYADGQTAIVQGHEHEVFGKDDVLKREFFKTVCGGA